jgi:hypothetical protein
MQKICLPDDFKTGMCFSRLLNSTMRLHSNADLKARSCECSLTPSPDPSSSLCVPSTHYCPLHAWRRHASSHGPRRLPLARPATQTGAFLLAQRPCRPHNSYVHLQLWSWWPASTVSWSGSCARRLRPHPNPDPQGSFFIEDFGGWFGHTHTCRSSRSVTRVLIATPKCVAWRGYPAATGR